jgi:hypothetical protein
MKYLIPKNTHFAIPRELFRKSIPKCADFDWLFEVNFTESCWFDKSALGNDAEDWNYKLCGITKSTSLNNADSVLVAARPDLTTRGQFELTWYLNDKDRNFNWGKPGIIVDMTSPTLIRMTKKGKVVSIAIWQHGKEETKLEYETTFVFDMYREVGPSFGGNCKTPWDIIIWIDKDKM